MYTHQNTLTNQHKCGNTSQPALRPEGIDIATHDIDFEIIPDLKYMYKHHLTSFSTGEIILKK